MIESGFSGAYGSQSMKAVLTSGSAPLANRTVYFALGSQRRQAITDGAGRASVSLSLLSVPGEYEVRASFAGTAQEASSSAQALFTIEPQATQIALTPLMPGGYPESTCC
jgi:hypothetical protein